MEMTFLSWEFFAALGSIIILDLVLAGDNAVVIAMAANTLPAQLRKKAILIGTAGAVVVRLLMTLAAVWLLTIPFLQALGGLILLPIAVKLLAPAQTDEAVHVKEANSLMGAVKTILVADAAMGIDNVLAIAGAAGGHFLFVAMGLVISIPIVVGGSQIIGKVLDRFPILLYAGAGILGWTSGSMVVHDAIAGAYLQSLTGSAIAYILPALGAAAVCLIGWYRSHRGPKTAPQVVK